MMGLVSLLASKSKNLLWIAIAVAIFARIAVFGVSWFQPVNDQMGTPVSPAIMQVGNDIGFYLESSKKYLEISPLDLLRSISKYYQFDDTEFRSRGDRDVIDPRSLAATAVETIDYFIAPPAFPIAIGIFQYREGNTLPLSLFYLALSCALVAVWLRWLSARDISFFWLIGFALVPNPIWFTISITSDLIFAVAFAGFYFAYFSKPWPATRIALWVGFLLFCLLSRPNGLSVLLFVVADLVLSAAVASLRWRNITLVLMAVLALLFTFVLFPHFFIFARRAMLISYFGISQSDYLSGIYSGLPAWLDRPFSWVSLAGAKVLYFNGLRPSYGDLPWYLLVLRSAGGVLWLPGFLYLVFYGDRSHRLLLGLYFLPVFIGASQDRYALAIQPVLYFYGIMALHLVWNRMRGDIESVSPSPTPKGPV